MSTALDLDLQSRDSGDCAAPPHLTQPKPPVATPVRTFAQMLYEAILEDYENVNRAADLLSQNRQMEVTSTTLSHWCRGEGAPGPAFAMDLDRVLGFGGELFERHQVEHPDHDYQRELAGLPVKRKGLSGVCLRETDPNSRRTCGTVGTYTAGCRGMACRTAATDYRRQWKLKGKKS